MFEKDVEVAVDGDAKKPRRVGKGEYTKKGSDHNKTKALEV